jgi:hypothetical protein
MKLNSFKKKDKVTPVQEKGSLNLVADNQTPRYKYDKNWENRVFLDTVKASNIKSILTNVGGAPIALSNGFGYMQILGVQGKDVFTSSPAEQVEFINGYKQWLDAIDFDVTEITTRLPTDTRTQILELKRKLEIVIPQLLLPDLDERVRVQLEMRRDGLTNSIKVLEIVEREHFNTEFFIAFYGRTLEELNYKTRVALSASTTFKPKMISVEKKEQLITTLYDPNRNGEF